MTVLLKNKKDRSYKVLVKLKPDNKPIRRKKIADFYGKNISFSIEGLAFQKITRNEWP